MIGLRVLTGLLLSQFIWSSDSGDQPSISIFNNIRNETVISVQSDIHIDYGLSYPLTYQFNVPNQSENLEVYRKFKFNEEWNLLIKKTHDDFFNGIDAVRFDYGENIAYVSIGFSSISDSIYLKFTDQQNNTVISSFSEISKYYDNREAAVTITADDWAGWNNQNFVVTCQNFRSLNLWLSCAVITDIYDPIVWENIQEQLDLGFIEVVSHSRTHPYIPYIDIESEVLGSKQDLIENLNLPSLNRFGMREYVYAWVAPYGEYDENIDTLVSFGKYLVSRMFYWNDNHYSEWDNTLNKFYPIGASIEVGSSSYWGSTDIAELNYTFDDVSSSNGIYHLMTHPNILEWDEDFTWDHLQYISNRNNIWYVGFGHLYLYRFLSSTNQGISMNLNTNSMLAIPDIKLYNNYPNPFNPTTTIKYEVLNSAHIKIEIYDMLGNRVKKLSDNFQLPGEKILQWDSTNDQGQSVSAGIYLCAIDSKDFKKTKKMILIK